MLSNSAKYAMKAVLFLALHSSENKKLMVKDISGQIDVPKAYLAKLLQELSKHSIISSTRGPKGGFYLTGENRNLALSKIVSVIDGDKKIEGCILGFEDCNEVNPCPLHDLVNPAKSELFKKLQLTTIKELAEGLKDKKTFL